MVHFLFNTVLLQCRCSFGSYHLMVGVYRIPASQNDKVVPWQFLRQNLEYLYCTSGALTVFDLCYVSSELWWFQCPGFIKESCSQCHQPCSHWGQEEGQGAVCSLQEIAGIDLPGQEQGHCQVNKHSHAASDMTDVGTEAVALAPQQQAPAQIGHQWQVEKHHL